MFLDKKQSEFLLYQSEDGTIKINVRLEDNTVWLTQADMVELFQTSKSNVSEHYEVNYYNLDIIISVGYRIKSFRGTQFRIYVYERLD